MKRGKSLLFVATFSLLTMCTGCVTQTTQAGQAVSEQSETQNFDEVDTEIYDIPEEDTEDYNVDSSDNETAIDEILFDENNEYDENDDENSDEQYSENSYIGDSGVIRWSTHENESGISEGLLHIEGCYYIDGTMYTELEYFKLAPDCLFNHWEEGEEDSEKVEYSKEYVNEMMLDGDGSFEATMEDGLIVEITGMS